MNHAQAATTLYRIGVYIEVLSDWCPPVKNLMSGYIGKINALADWHQKQSLQAR